MTTVLLFLIIIVTVGDVSKDRVCFHINKLVFPLFTHASTPSTINVRADSSSRGEFCGHKLTARQRCTLQVQCRKAIWPCNASRSEYEGEI